MFAKVAALITSIPDCVLGGVTTFLFANVVVSGIAILGAATLDIATLLLERSAGDGSLRGEAWDDVPGLIARLVLLDQLSRNVAFSITASAYCYACNH